MNKDLIIQSNPKGIEIALLEDKKLVELHFDNSGGNFNVGDLYLGKTRKIAPGLNAVFVDIGYEKDAFLHYTDLSPHFKSLQSFTNQVIADEKGQFRFEDLHIEPLINKAGKINDLVKSRQNLLVQILKEPIANKGPRVSCEISLPGRFLVLIPFNEVVNVSRKIASSEERKRLKSIITNIRPKNFGIIVRTAAENKSTSELHQDLIALEEQWKNIQRNLINAQPKQKILSEQNKTTSLLRDLLNDDFSTIVTNDAEVHRETKEYIAKISPGKEKIVNFHKNGKAIFDEYGINKQLKSSFGKTVMLNNGGYLIIEHTEALHVIDVNSGHKFSAENQEHTALQTNLEAVKEIARQLRLRDIGGIIIVDLIDMRNQENRRLVSKAMVDAMESDRARHSVLGISKFGLMQVTRQRLRPEIKIPTGETCPSCGGSGRIRSTHVLVEDLEKHVKYLNAQLKGKLELRTHPIVYSHLTKGLFSSIFKNWKKKYGKFTLSQNNELGFTEYKFYNTETSEEIKF